MGCVSPGGFLCLLCAASFLQGLTVNGFVNSVVSSLERRFRLHGAHSGLIASAYDVAACLCLPFVSYLGGRGHKPCWLGCGLLVLGTGSLLFALPHFTAGPYEAVDGHAATCTANRTQCPGGAPGPLSAPLLLVLGQLLHGVGTTPLYTLGLAYLDENVQPSRAPVYMGEGHPEGAWVRVRVPWEPGVRRPLPRPVLSCPSVDLTAQLLARERAEIPCRVHQKHLRPGLPGAGLGVPQGGAHPLLIL